MAIKSWSTTPGSNNMAVPDGAPEGWAPSQVNAVVRQHMADHRDQWNDAEWFEYGDGDLAATYTWVSSTQFKVVGVDVTTQYAAGRAIKITGSTVGTVYGYISTSSFSTDTTVTLTSAILHTSSETISSVKLSILKQSTTQSALPSHTAIKSTGSFTATLTGVSGSVTGTAYYHINGSAVTLYLPALTGTSNTTACTITGLPAAIYPAYQFNFTAWVINDSLDTLGRQSISASTGVITLRADVSATTFSAINTKGLPYQATVTYFI